MIKPGSRERQTRCFNHFRMVSRHAFVFAMVGLGACSTVRPAVELHRAITGSETVASQRVDQPGVSFTPPPERTWLYLVRSTYQVLLRAEGSSANETYVTAVSIYQLPSVLSPEQFLAHVKSERAAEPETGRFETVSNNEQMYTERPEVCVKHRTTSKDYGAKRGGDFSIVDYLGMNCIHPSSERVGVFVELSRKAPTGADESFDDEGIRLLRSVAFSQFR